jgi:hypothetical protein
MFAAVIEITPHRYGWKVFEAPGVKPVFSEKDQAIHYAKTECPLSDFWIRQQHFAIARFPCAKAAPLPTALTSQRNEHENAGWPYALDSKTAISSLAF